MRINRDRWDEVVQSSNLGIGKTRWFLLILPVEYELSKVATVPVAFNHDQ